MSIPHIVLAPHDWNQCQNSFCLGFLPARLTFTPSSGNKIPHLYFRDWPSPSCSHNTHTSHRNEPWTQAGPILVPHPHPQTGIHAEMGMWSRPIRTPWDLSNYSWRKGAFFPSGGKGVKMLSPQWSATMNATSWGEMAQEKKDTQIDPDTRNREEERLSMVLDPAVPEVQPFPQMDYARQ